MYRIFFVVLLFAITILSGSIRAENILWFPFDHHVESTCGFAGSFGCPKYTSHEGTDYAVAEGTRIYASISGTVQMVNDEPGQTCTWSFGNYVQITGANYRVIEAHMLAGSIVVSNGNFVEAGQYLGLSSNSGYTLNAADECMQGGGYHLHLQVEAWQNDTWVPVDPYVQDGGMWIDPLMYGGQNLTFHASNVSELQNPTYPPGLDYYPVAPGQVLPVEFIFNNTGTAYWTNDPSSPHYVELHSVNNTWNADAASPVAYNWLDNGGVRIATTSGNVDAETGQGLYAFEILAPDVPGDYWLYVALYRPHSGEFFSGTDPTLHIRVIEPNILMVPTDYPTIQEAVNAAQDGDIVEVSAGIYYEIIIIDSKDITLRSTDGPELTIIDGSQGCDYGIVGIGFSNATLEGFTIRNCLMGGIGCFVGSPTIRNCIIENCGNAAINLYQSSAIIDNCIIQNCDGIGILSESCSPTIERCTIWNCSGSAISAHDGSPIIRNNLVINNTVSGGGAITYWSIESNVDPLIMNNTVAFNVGTGIAVSYGPPVPMSPRISSNIVTNNTGYGIVTTNSDANVFPIEYNNVWGNDLGNYGGYYSDQYPPEMNISDDPLYIGGDPFDFRIQSITAGFPVNSSCVDNGDPDPQYNDLDGTPNDMGAYGGPNAFFPQEPGDELLDETVALLPEDFDEELAETGSINTGNSTTKEILIDVVSRAWRIILNWPGSELRLSVYRPDGTLADEWQSTEPPIIAEFIPDTIGTWQFEVMAIDVPYDNYPYALVAGSLPLGSISGTVADSSGTVMYSVPIDLYEDATNTLLVSEIADSTGSYSVPNLIPGIYNVSITTPLGYQADAEAKLITVTGGADSAVNFVLSQLDIVPAQRSRGYWKHEVGHIIKNIEKNKNKPTDYTADDFADFLALTESHFAQNQVNPMLIYEGSTALTQLDSLKLLKNLLSAKKSNDNDENKKLRKAKAELMTLILNVVAGKISQAEVISHDSANVSQAITYSWMLLTEQITCTDQDDDDDEYRDEDECVCNYKKAKKILKKINHGKMVKAGVIPLNIDFIAYKSGDQEDLPIKFSLSQNYPNPFNPVTVISYSLPKSTDVTVDIYNVIGQKVATLVNGRQEAGIHNISWDASSYSSGIYLYRITTNMNTQSKKMVLMK